MSWRDWTSSIRSSSLLATVLFTAPPFSTKKAHGSWIWVVAQASGVLTWPSESFCVSTSESRLFNLVVSDRKYRGGIHVGIDLNYTQPELSVPPFSPTEFVALTRILASPPTSASCRRTWKTGGRIWSRAPGISFICAPSMAALTTGPECTPRSSGESPRLKSITSFC